MNLKSVFISFICLSFVIHVNGQNLVQNGDFDDFTTCPIAPTQIDNANFWSKLGAHSGSSDFFHECHTGDLVSTPMNLFGEEPPFSGVGYAGTLIQMYPGFADFQIREYFVNELECELMPGITYEVSCQVSLAEGSEEAEEFSPTYGIPNGLQFFFSDAPITGSGTFSPLFPTYDPQCQPLFSSPSSDGWTSVIGTFVADGGELHMTVGNFFEDGTFPYEDSDGNPIPLDEDPPAVYFYIDNIIVTPVFMWTESISICSSDAPTNLNALVTDGSTGTWSGIGVTGSMFDPSVGTQDITYTVDYGCGTASTTHTINVTDGPVIDAGLDMTVCDGEMVTLIADNPDLAVIAWSGGIIDGVPFTPGLGATTYTVTATSIDGCESTDDIDITVVNIAPIVDAGVDFEICTGTPVVLNADNPDGAVISWSDGVIDGVTFTPDVGIITYTVTATDIDGCESSDDVTVTVNSLPTVNAGEDIFACVGDPITLTAFNPDDASIIWSSGIIDGVSFTPSEGSIDYTVIATDVNGCSSTDNVNVTVNPTPSPNLTANVTLGCEPLLVTFSDEGTPLPGTTCLWEFGDGTSSNSCGIITHNYLSTGEFDVSLTLISDEGCSATYEVTELITVTPTPDASFTTSSTIDLDINNTNVEFFNQSTNADSFEWDFDDGSAFTSETNPEHSFPNSPAPAEYTVLLTAFSEGKLCYDTFQQTIRIRDVVTFYIPNTFTPDGDSFNQTFQPVFTSGFDPFDYHLIIFNRYGEILFESFDASVGWNGTYGNRDIVQDGVYTWRIEFGDTNSDEKHQEFGHVNLIR